MASPLSGSLARTIHKAMSPLFLDAVLTRDVISTSPDLDPFDPPAPSPVTYPCKAVRENYGVGHRGGGLVEAGDVKIIVLQQSLSVTPQPLDRITIQGETFTIISASGQPSVMADPASATWELRARA